MSKRIKQTESVSAREKVSILQAVAEKHGVLTPDLVVQEAAPGNADGVAHRLASLVGWHLADDAAAMRWRADQARAVIRSVEPELITLGVVTLEAPHYIRDPTKLPSEQGYAPLLGFKSREEAASDAVRSEIRRAIAALERAFSISQALGLEGEAATVLAALAALGHAPAMKIAGSVGEGSLASREA